jgi:hypothetical protein
MLALSQLSYGPGMGAGDSHESSLKASPLLKYFRAACIAPGFPSASARNLGRTLTRKVTFAVNREIRGGF